MPDEISFFSLWWQVGLFNSVMFTLQAIRMWRMDWIDSVLDVDSTRRLTLAWVVVFTALAWMPFAQLVSALAFPVFYIWMILIGKNPFALSPAYKIKRAMAYFVVQFGKP